MKQVHVECFPDEALVKQLGFKKVTHHAGKSRVFGKLKKEKGQCAMVDEDPGTVKTAFERGLKLERDEEGLLKYRDSSGNNIIVLKGKLEDWILTICKRYKVNITEFGLPDKPNELHERIHQRLPNFEKLISYLLQNNNKAMLTLQDFLQN